MVFVQFVIAKILWLLVTIQFCDNTIQTEGLGNFFKNLGKKDKMNRKNWQKNVLNNPSGALDITPNLATALASRNPKQGLKSLPELITFYNTGKGLYLHKIVYFFIIQIKQKTQKLYPSATLLEKIVLEKTLENKLNDVNSFNNSINNIKVLITYFKDKNNKSKYKKKKLKTLTTIVKSFDTIVIIATTSSSITLSFTGIDLIAIPISSSVARGKTTSKKVSYEIIMQKYNKYKKQY